MENRLVEFELNMQTLFNTNFHFDHFIFSRLFLNVLNDELLLCSDFIVWSIDDNINVVPQSDYNTLIALKLFFDTIKLEIVIHIISQCSWGL